MKRKKIKWARTFAQRHPPLPSVALGSPDAEHTTAAPQAFHLAPPKSTRTPKRPRVLPLPRLRRSSPPLGSTAGIPRPPRRRRFPCPPMASPSDYECGCARDIKDAVRESRAPAHAAGELVFLQATTTSADSRPTSRLQAPRFPLLKVHNQKYYYYCLHLFSSFSWHRSNAKLVNQTMLTC